MDTYYPSPEEYLNPPKTPSFEEMVQPYLPVNAFEDGDINHPTDFTRSAVAFLAAMGPTFEERREIGREWLYSGSEDMHVVADKIDVYSRRIIAIALERATINVAESANLTAAMSLQRKYHHIRRTGIEYILTDETSGIQMSLECSGRTKESAPSLKMIVIR
jgi:hypothetical protein